MSGLQDLLDLSRFKTRLEGSCLSFALLMPVLIQMRGMAFDFSFEPWPVLMAVFLRVIAPMPAVCMVRRACSGSTGCQLRTLPRPKSESGATEPT